MSATDDNLETGILRPSGVVHELLRGPDDRRFRWVVWGFLLGSVSHLLLADAAQPDWYPANALYVFGLVFLLTTGGAIGWLFSALGLLIPLLFLRDQLTQSVFLLGVSVAGALFTCRDDTKVRVDSFLWTVRGLTIVTYCMAVFHKLNEQFLDPRYSCANYGMDELYQYYRLEPGWFAALEPLHPFVALGFEVAIPLLYVVRLRHAARIVTVVFHIPLTLTMAPAFVFVMAAGHAAFLTDEEREQLVAVLRARWKPLLAVSIVATVASVAANGSINEWMLPREWMLWFALAWVVAATPTVGLFHRSREPGVTTLLPTVAPGAVIVALFVLNCFTPYLGVQYQHAAAMLSNLRIDRGCWNHYIVPESARLTEDYVRVHEVWFGEPGRIEEYENIVLDQLWSPPQIRQMRRNWCRDEIRPFYMQGTFRDETWTIEDLCDEDEAWPFEADGVFGVELFGDALRFQKNLERTCPQACIH